MRHELSNFALPRWSGFRTSASFDTAFGSNPARFVAQKLMDQPGFKASRDTSLEALSACSRLWRACSSAAASAKSSWFRGWPREIAMAPNGTGFRDLSHLRDSTTAGRQSAPIGISGTPVAAASTSAPGRALRRGPPPSGVMIAQPPLIRCRANRATLGQP